MFSKVLGSLWKVFYHADQALFSGAKITLKITASTGPIRLASFLRYKKRWIFFFDCFQIGDPIVLFFKCFIGFSLRTVCGLAQNSESQISQSDHALCPQELNEIATTFLLLLSPFFSFLFEKPSPVETSITERKKKHTHTSLSRKTDPNCNASRHFCVSGFNSWVGATFAASDRHHQ